MKRGFNYDTIERYQKGDFFVLNSSRPIAHDKVYIKGEYDYSSKTYSCYKFSDVNAERFFKGNKIIYTDFEF